MELAIRSVSVNGRSYPIATGSVQQEGEQGLGANRRTAEMVGGGALLGTLLGAAVGGGKGAAVGAAVGAAGGATAQVLTRGKQVNVPAETVLTFRLDQPWRLQGFSYL
jgi:outer membrane lipoprotein SlyB